ncbi:hypothetical protein AOQ84DRAFT_364953, partial [Glonium stellatum]
MFNLLYMQAELTELQAQFEAICVGDSKGSLGLTDTKEYAINFKRLRESEGTAYNHQLEKFKVIQKKLSKYNKCLCQAAEMSRLGKPQKDDLAWFRRWLGIAHQGKPFLPGTENETWKNDKDLVTLYFPQPDCGPLLPWFSRLFLDIFHALFGGCMKA